MIYLRYQIKNKISNLQTQYQDYKEFRREKLTFEYWQTYSYTYLLFQIQGLYATVFGIYKVISTGMYLYFGRSHSEGPSDLISKLLHLSTIYLGTKVPSQIAEVVFYYGSIIFLGILMATNIRSLIFHVTKLIRFLFGSSLINIVSEEMLLLFFTEMIGVSYSPFPLQEFSLIYFLHFRHTSFRPFLLYRSISPHNLEAILKY